MSESGRRVLVTGAASGIGRAIACRFRENGAVVAGIDRDADLLADVDLDHRATCDVSDEDHVRAAVDDAAGALGGIDVVVASAGVTSSGTVADLESEEWDRVMNINVRGLFLTAKYAIPHLRRAPAGGTIVNVASQLGLVAAPDNAAYCASKGAVIQLTKAMAIDHARDGITVNAVCPGPTWTPALERHIASTPEPEKTERLFASTTLHERFVTVEEVAAAALYLASLEARSTTGACLVVDGGYTAR